MLSSGRVAAENESEFLVSQIKLPKMDLHLLLQPNKKEYNIFFR
jgi:hypothetical protein